MDKRKRASFVRKVLNEHFPDPEIPLDHSSPFTLLIAVLLSAQCTDKAVNKVTPKLFALADTPQKMMELSQEKIQKVIKTIGLSKTKSKYILSLCKILVEKHKGQVPKTFAALEKLPGVGHKTASVVMSQAFNKPAFPVDTHIHRCAQRWGLSDGINVTRTEKDLKELFPKTKWNLLHLQIIYFARKFCKATGHKKELCPICCKLEEK